SAEAKSCDSAMNVPADHFINQSDQHTRTACSDGMPQRNRAAIDIDTIHVESEFADHAERLHGKRLVQFIEVDIRILPSGLLPNLLYGRYWSHHDPFRIDTAGCLRNDPNHRSRA